MSSAVESAQHVGGIEAGNMLNKRLPRRGLGNVGTGWAADCPVKTLWSAATYAAGRK